MRPGYSNQEPGPSHWDGESAPQEEVEDERVFYTRSPSPPRPSQYHSYSRDPQMPRRPLLGRAGGPRGRGRGGSDSYTTRYPPHTPGRIALPVVPPRGSSRITGLPSRGRPPPVPVQPPLARDPSRRSAPVYAHPPPPHRLPPPPKFHNPRRPDSHFPRAWSKRTSGWDQRPQPVVALEVQARDNRVERQRTLEEYKITFKSFDEQPPTRPRTKGLIVVDEDPKYIPFFRRPFTRDIRSAMFRERWKAANSAGASGANAIAVDDSDSDSDADIPSPHTSSMPRSPLFTPPKTPLSHMTPAPRPRQVARKMPGTHTVPSICSETTHGTSEGETSEHETSGSVGSSSSNVEVERDRATPRQPTQEEAMPEKLRELFRSLTHNGLEHYNRRRIPFLTRNLKQSFTCRYKQKFRQPKMDQHSVKWVRYIFRWLSENGEEQEWSYREEGRAGLECPFCPFWGEFATQNILEAHFKDKDLGVHHELDVEFDGKEEEGRWEAIIWLDKTHDIPSIMEEIPVSPQIIVKPEPSPETTDNLSDQFSSLSLLENDFPTAHRYGPLGLMGPIYHWRRRDLLEYEELSEAAKRLHTLWSTYHALHCTQFVRDPVPEIETFLDKYWNIFYSPAPTFRREALHWMLEIKESFKLQQIHLLDLIESFDNRVDSRQHGPSPEI